MSKTNYEEVKKATYDKVEIHQLINFDKKPKNPIKVSIIMPVCNVEMYLRECLESAINQTLEDIEIICVNDGSKDGSLSILEEYASKDERVKVIDKENAGYGHAMNIGMDMAQGEYIGILESDDYVKLDMYETLYEIASVDNIDIVKADFYRFTDQDGYLRLYYNVLSNNDECYNKIVPGANNVDMYKFTNTWSGIYNRKFLNEFEIRHQETPGASYQDNGFWFQTTSSARTIFYLDKPFYMNRRDNPNSSVYQTNKIYMGNKEYAYIYKFLEKNPEIKEKNINYYIFKKFDNYFYNYNQISGELKKEYLLKFSEEFKESYDKGEIDRTLFSESRYNTLLRIIENPLDYYEETKDNEGIKFNVESKEDNIPIVMICDDGYAVPTATAIRSMNRHKKKETKYDITIVAVNMDDKHIRKLAMLKYPNITINIIYIEENEFNNLHNQKVTNYGVPATALIKFLLPEMMQHYKKVIYLDGDIVVKRDLTELYNQQLGECYAGVVRDMPQVLYTKQIFGVKYGRGYFNSGMMLLNIEAMNNDNIKELLIETKRTLDSKLMDQDVFNEVFGEKIVQLPIKYNTLYVNLIRSKGKYKIENIDKKYKKLEDIRRDSAIIHYCSKDKPWKYFDVPMADAWLEHYFRSAYGDRKIVRKSSKTIEEQGFFNGAIQYYENSKKVYPIVFHYTSLNTEEIINNLKIIASYKESVVGYDIYIIYDAENNIPKYIFDKCVGPNIEINYVCIDKMIARDMEYSANGKLHDNYYRMVLPEILCQYDEILVVDGAVINKDMGLYLKNSSWDATVSILKYGDFSFWNSPVMIINVKKFVCNITKFKFFDAYNDKKCANYKPTNAIQNVIPKSSMGVIDAWYFAEYENKQDAVEALISSVQNELNEKSKKIEKLVRENEQVNKQLTDKNKQIADKDKTIERLDKELYMTRTSFSCKLGLAITAIPRKIFRRGK